MTDSNPSSILRNPPKNIRQGLIVTGISLTAFAVITKMMLDANNVVGVEFNPQIAPLLKSHAVLQVHVYAAIATFLIGSILLLKPKGTGFHKTLGWSWVIAMAATAVSSFFLRGLMGDSFSPIHALSAWTMIVLPMAIVAIRRKDVKAHSKHMTGMFVGGMAVAGLFSFLPGRLMWSLLFTAQSYGG